MGENNEPASSDNNEYKYEIRTYLNEGERTPSTNDPNAHETSPMLDHKEFCPEAQVELESNFDLLNRTKIRYALGICIAFFIVELVSGFLTHSLAILSDSFHLLSDIAGFLVSLVAFHLSRRPATSRHSYGFYRIEVLGALGSTFIIWAMTGILVWEAIGRIKSPVEINAVLMFSTAAAGLVVNIIIGLVLNTKHSHGSGFHSHSHSHSHHTAAVAAHDSPITPTVNSQEFFSRKRNNPSQDISSAGNTSEKRVHKNINVESASIHVIGDIISSLGVLIASVIIMYRPDFLIVDPICTFIFSILVIFTTLRIIRNSLTVLMEATPSGIDSSQVYNDLLLIKGVKDVHDLHIWNLTLGKPSLSAHLQIATPPHFPVEGNGPNDPPTFEKEYTRILSSAQNLICSKYGIHHVTIQIETDDYQDSYSAIDVSSLTKSTEMPNLPGMPSKQISESQIPLSKSSLFQRYRPHCDNAMCRMGFKKQTP